MERGWWDINGHTHVYLGDGSEAIHAWAEMMNDTARRTVATDEVNHVFVSTVFLGADHNYFPKGPPLLFETMLFVHEGGDQKYDHLTWHHATWDEASAWHKKVVRMIRAGKDTIK